MELIDDYIKSRNLVINEDLGNKYLLINTDFEKMKIIFAPQNLFSSMDNLIRFIDPEFLELYTVEELRGIYFVPSHIEKKIKAGIADDILDSICNRYLPEDMQTTFDEDEYDKPLVESKNRHSYGTSFFQCMNMDRATIEDTVSLLTKEIRSLRDHKIAIGQIKEDCGLLEKSSIKKTEEPESRHCSFWKFEFGGTFDEISKDFSLLELR